jgi:hypothetical protein
MERAGDSMVGKPVYLKNSEWLDVSEEDYLWLDFTIEKTYSALCEAGKKLEKLFVAYLVLLAVAGVLTYSRSLGGSGDFKVPFLALSLDRRHLLLPLQYWQPANCSALFAQPSMRRYCDGGLRD